MTEGKSFTNFVSKCEVTDGPASVRPLTIIGVAEFCPSSAAPATLHRPRQQCGFNSGTDRDPAPCAVLQT